MPEGAQGAEGAEGAGGPGGAEEGGGTVGVVQAYVAVGSNIDPRANLPAALRLLRRRVEVTGLSTVYRTRALGRGGEAGGGPDFCNAVWAIRTSHPARELKFGVLRGIEDALGRSRGPDRYAPRTIDLDLVLYGDEAIDEPGLCIPAPDVARPFVAWPLSELAPLLVLPGTGEPIRRVCERAGRGGMEPDEQLTRLIERTIAE